MSAPAIQKAIWRRPGETGIFYITEGPGDDEFIAAPFMKGAPTAVIKGHITPADSMTLNTFFGDLPLSDIAVPENTTQTHYTAAVKRAVEAIRQGRFEKVVLARRQFVAQSIQLQKVFSALAQHYPQAFVYCFILADGTCMMGASPETLLIKNNNILTTEALGGTARAKGYSEKEYLEHRQIITDISDKLKQLNYSFSVGTTAPRQAGNVAHLATAFQINSRSVANDLQLLNSLHPTAAVCGLPYEAAYHFILKEEDMQRNYYAGYLGIRTGDDFSCYVNLRCAEVYQNGVLLFAGAGINRDSDPEDEWAETGEKMNTLLSQLV